MIKNGQTTPGIETIGFANASREGFDFECLDLMEVIHRVGKNHFESPRRLAFFQILSLVDGVIDEEIDFVHHRLGPGLLAFLRPGQVQRMSVSPQCSGRLLLFAPSFISGAEHGPDTRQIAPVVRATQSIADSIEMLVHEYASSNASRDVLFHDLVALLLRLQRESEPCMPVANPEFAQAFLLTRRFEDLLEATFAQHRSTSAMARELGCTEKSLNRACRKAAGLPPKTIVQQRVALEAKRILAHTSDPVKLIAAQLGFTEPTNFVKFFRRATGESPTVFRTRNQKAM